ncbi:MAG: sulfate ABC transporter substrate-binding protein, partial [Thaumarchaeota archaeon]|nr:sulfate ABC transporter substrate-binding protein [Nitrososphaerota archaeon]
MKSGIKFAIAGAIIAIVIALSVISQPVQERTMTTSDSGNVLRIGYFPNINHAQAVIGVGNGDYQKTLGDIKLESQVFNAGPSAIEALFANQVDVTYVGPGPATNGYIRSDGDLKIISGVASGGAVFVVRNDAGIKSPQDFV